MAEPICTLCQKTGPVLMPLRYAIVPDTLTQPLSAWATPKTAFPALSSYHYALRTLRPLVGKFIASWPVMIAVNLAPVLVMLLTDNKLQNWCEQCVFGNSSVVEKPRDMTSEQRKTVEEEQEEKLEEALHEVFGLPVSEKLKEKEITEAGNHVQEIYSHGISSQIMTIKY